MNSKFHNNKEIGTVYYIKGGIIRTVLATYRGLVLLWQSIRSCFGSGKWANEQPWSNEEAWKN